MEATEAVCAAVQRSPQEQGRVQQGGQSSRQLTLQIAHQVSELVKKIPVAALVRDVPSWLVTVPEWLQCINAIPALSESVARQLKAGGAGCRSCTGEGI